MGRGVEKKTLPQRLCVMRGCHNQPIIRCNECDVIGCHFISDGVMVAEASRGERNASRPRVTHGVRFDFRIRLSLRGVHRKCIIHLRFFFYFFFLLLLSRDAVRKTVP